MSGDALAPEETDPIDDYHAAMRSELSGIPNADDTLAELEDHLREAADALVAQGQPPASAAREAVGRFGPAALIGRRIRAEHGRPRSDDPAPGRGWPFTVAEILLILAALSAGAAIYVHWLPCGGDALPRVGCGARMDTNTAFPFAPEAGERSLLADGFRLTGLLLMALAWLSFAIGQPWRPLRRSIIALPIVPLVTMAADTAWLIANPAAEPHWWADTLILCVVDGLAVFTFVAINDAPPYGPCHRLERALHTPAPMTYGVFRWRVILLLVAVSAPGFSRISLEFSIMTSISDLNWDTPPGTGYLTATFLGVPALASAVLGFTTWLRGRRTANSPQRPAEVQPNPGTLFTA